MSRYLVLHDDYERGAAIVAALGGELAARQVGSLQMASDIALQEGPPAALLVAIDVTDGYVTGPQDAPGLKGVPIVYDGGKTGSVYRAFVRHWRAGTPFHHLVQATPEEAARALAGAAMEPARPRRFGWWRALLVVSLVALILINWFRPELLPARLHSYMQLFLAPTALVLVSGPPVVAALRRGIRPSRGAIALVVFWLLLLVAEAWAVLARRT